MSREQWARLQQQLSNFGYLASEDVVEVVSDRDISAELIAAITAAQENVSDSIAVPVRESAPGRYQRLCRYRRGLARPILRRPRPRWRNWPPRLWIAGRPVDPRSSESFARYHRLQLREPAAFTPDHSSRRHHECLQSVAGGIELLRLYLRLARFCEDIRVIFGGATVDSRFGRQGGVIASAGFPERGNLQFDATEAWTTNTLLGAALHEIGHLLGLSHSNAPGGTMYPYANTAVTIDAESRNAIAAMYGWQPQQRIGDRGTSDRASLGVTSTSNFTSRSEIPQMVWKGVGDDSGIYFSEFRGEWTPQQRVSGVGCSHSPSLAEIGIPGGIPATGLFMAWKGVEGDSGIYWTRNMGAGWESQRGVAGIGSSAGPALANVNGRIYMAWKGAEDDSGIYWSTYDGAEGWSPQANIAGVGTSDSPALVAYNDMLYMFWKGVSGDSNAYYSFFDFTNDPIWKPQRRIEYFSYETGGGIPYAIGTTGPLSAAVRGNSIILTWKGVEGDSAIWFSLFQNNEFSGQTMVPNVGTSVGPSVVQADGRTYMAWKGIDGDSSIYWSRL